MTPLAMEIYKANPFSKVIEGAHFFDACEIYEEVMAATEALWKKIHAAPEFCDDLVLKLPFERTWVEFAEEGQRKALLFETIDKHNAIALTAHSIIDGSHASVFLAAFPGGVFEQGKLLEDVSVDFDACGSPLVHTILFALTMMLIINTPQSFIVRQRRNRQFARAHQRKFGHKAWALGAWTEIKLEIDPDLVRQIEGSAQRVSGKKCFHWVKGHWKRIFGNTLRIWIGPYTRGDAQLGIAQRRYNPVPPARARTKAQRREAVERCARIEAVLARDCREPERTASPSDAARQGRPAARRRASKASNAPRSLSK